MTFCTYLRFNLNRTVFITGFIAADHYLIFVLFRTFCPCAYLNFVDVIDLTGQCFNWIPFTSPWKPQGRFHYCPTVLMSITNDGLLNYMERKWVGMY